MPVNNIGGSKKKKKTSYDKAKAVEAGAAKIKAYNDAEKYAFKPEPDGTPYTAAEYKQDEALKASIAKDGLKAAKKAKKSTKKKPIDPDSTYAKAAKVGVALWKKGKAMEKSAKQNKF